jgi:hypothetical protein
MEINLREYSQRTQPLLQPFSSICIATLKKKNRKFRSRRLSMDMVFRVSLWTMHVSMFHAMCSAPTFLMLKYLSEVRTK